MRQLTMDCPPTEMIQSEYGEITYAKWCEREVKRLNQDGESCWVREQDGRVAVWTRMKKLDDND